MRLIVKDIGRGFFQLMLLRSNQIFGTANVTKDEYRDAVKALFLRVQDVVKSAISEKLGEALWRDAVSMAPGGEAELAKDKLLEFGWNQQKIENYAHILTEHLVHQLLKLLPDHR